jgi:hypothetical protein
MPRTTIPLTVWKPTDRLKETSALHLHGHGAWRHPFDPFLHLIFDGVWIEDSHIVTVQPKPSFLPFFEHKDPAAKAGVNDGSDGGRTRD